MSDENTETIVDPVLTAGDPPPADPPADPIVPEAPQPRMIPADVLVREVTPLRARLRESETIIDEHRRKLRDAEDLIARLQRPADGTTTQQPPQPRQTEPPQQFTQTDVERAAAELNFKRDAAKVIQSGQTAYGTDWQSGVNLLGSFGLDSADFVGSVMDVAGIENTHAVIHSLTRDPEKVAALAGMTPQRRIAEITRIADKMATKPAAGATETQPAPKTPERTVSRAPAPAPRVDPSASQVVDWRSDKASDADFSKGWEENMARRKARR